MAGVIEENFAVSQRSLGKIISAKSDHVTLFFKWHDPKILQGVHIR